MKKMNILIFLAGAYVVFGANDTDDVHISNIERAITGLPAVLSNSLGTVRYDFTAILREIKTVKIERLRVGLLEKSIQPLFLVDGKQWEHNPQTEMLRKRESMLEEAFALTEGEEYIVFRWLNRLRLYQSMKQELALYADAEPPDEEALKKQLLQDFTEEIERRKAKAPGEPIVFSRSVSPPKEWRDAKARMGYKKWLQSHIRSYEKDNFDALKFKVDYEDLPDKERQPLMEKVRKELGRYPKWYQPDDGKPQPKSKILEDEIHSFAGMLSGTGQLVRAWATGTNLLARIVDEPDEHIYMSHFKEMESAILGMKFREGPFADSYNEWDHSIVMFGKLSSWYSVSFWKKRKDSPLLWEFYLKLLNVYRKEIERIANAKEKTLPPRFNGIHGTLEVTRSRLKLDQDMILRKFSSHNFVSNYLAITQSERVRWLQRIEEAAGIEFKFEVDFQTTAKKLKAIGAPVKDD